MSRTSKVLKRLGVAGLVAATIGAGVPAFIGTAAQAATPGPTTHLSITPAAQQGAAGTCLLYTVTPLDANNGTPSDTGSQTIQLEAVPTNYANTQVQFCDPTPDFAANGNASQAATTGGPFGPTPNTPATSTTTSAVTPSNTTGAQTFGLRGYQPGGATIRAYIDQPGGNPGQFDAGEPSATATATFTAGGNNTADDVSGGNAAQDAVKTISEIAQDASANPVAAGTGSGSRQFITVQLKNASGDPVSGVTVSAVFGSGAANGAQTSPVATAQPITCVGGSSTTTGGVTSPPGGAGTATTGSQGGPVSNNVGTATCYYTAARSGTDTIIVYVNQTQGGGTGGPDAGEPQLTVTRNTLGAPNTNTAQARTLDLTPEGPVDTQSGATRVFTATVKDAAGTPVQGVNVQFTKSGAGTFNGASQTPTTATNAQGQASVSITSATGETGQAVVTATITTPGTQCGNAAGSPTGTTSAGNCSDSEVTNFVTGTPSPTGSPGGRAALTLVVNTPTIPAGSTGRLTATGAANEAYQLMCYTRPSTTFALARSGTFNAAGDPVTFTLSLGRNTRCFIQYATTSTQGASPSVVINVRTVLSLSTVRTAVRTYTFQGRNLPRVAGQLITLYRVDNAGNEIRTSNLVTDSTGIYRVSRHFTGTGTFLFRVRTSQTNNNAAGVSNTISVAVH